MKLRMKNSYLRRNEEDLYQLRLSSKMPHIKSEKVSQSLEKPTSESQHQNVKVMKQSSPDSKYGRNRSPGVCIGVIQPQDLEMTLNAYCDLINSEQDLFVLYDSFPVMLNSLKQLHHSYQKQHPYSANSNQSSKDTSDWWKRNPDNQWSGMKNIIRLTKEKKEDSFLYNPDTNTTKSNHLQSNASSLLSKLKKEVGDMTEDHKINHQSRQIQGKTILVPFFDSANLKHLLTAPNKHVLAIYHQPNKHYKSHLGFCQYSINNNDSRITKLFIGRFFRRDVYLNQIVSQLLAYFSRQNVQKTKIQVNSGQSELIKALQGMGAVLLREAILIGNVKILTLCIAL